MTTSELAREIAGLSPEQQALLTLRLKKRRAEAVQQETISRREDLSTCPLSFAQQRLWFLDQFEPGSPFYNIPAAARLTGPLNVAALEQSLNEIVRRHEVLRATFIPVEGQAVQAIAPQLSLPVHVEDLRHLPTEEREEEALRLATQEAHWSFDLAQGPLVRVRLLRLDEEEHVLLLTMHHIVFDGWSTGVLVRELSALYEAFSLQEAPPLPDLPIQYADYADWQQQRLRGELLEGQLAYWKEQLANLPALLELPTDRVRPPVQTYRGAHHTFALPRGLYEPLQALSRQEGATLFMTLLAAFQTLLYRYTGQEGISVGTPIANRTRVEVEGLIGFFVNTLVMRTDLSAPPGTPGICFREVLKRVREVVLAAHAHQDLPFEMLVEALQPERDMSHTPLFQVMFDLQRLPLASVKMRNLALAPLEVESGTAKFDLSLVMLEGEGGLQGWLEYNTDLFEAATITALAGHWQALLEAIVADPNQPIRGLPLLTVAERRQLLVEWNDTETDWPREACIHQLFEAQVERTPQAVAVTFHASECCAEYSYAELNRRANQLAHALQKRGVGPERLVGLCVERSPEMIVGMLGVLKAGGAYVPMDPAYPPERLGFMLEDAQVSVLVTQERLLERLPAHEAEVVCLDRDGEAIAQEPETNPASGVGPQNLAYVIYTSGSTGRPKGTLLEHRGLCNLATAYARDIGAGPGSRVLQFFSFSFDGSVADCFVALVSGATLVLASQDALLPGPNLVQLLRDEAITSAMMPPSALSVLPVGEFPALHTLLSGGESCTREIVERWSPGRRFVNAYGPTEATVASSWFPVQGLSKEAASIPIGRPLANTQLYILDASQQPVPVGVLGELYIGGVGVARGYHNRPELTAEKFVPDPYAGGSAPHPGPLPGGQRGRRLYRTGDLVRYIPDGNIEFLGRIDQQVKVHGFRIELGEIEAVLRGHPAVREAVVLARQDRPDDKRLVAYVVPAADATPTAGELGKFLRGKLPEYMVPSALVMLDGLPLSPSGKVDRRALPAPDQVRPGLEVPYVAPRTLTEELLAGVWAHILGLERLGVHDNFFELGGHSLLVTLVLSRVRDIFQVELPLRNLFEAPTIAGLAESIEAARQATPGLTMPIRPIPRDVPLPLSFAQQRLWFLDQLEPGSPLYNVASAVHIAGPLNVAALEWSLNEIVRRHEVLRTTFPTVDGKAVQVIAPELAVSLPVTDLRHLPSEAREAAARRLAVQEARRPFDLAREALLRTTLLRLDEEAYMVLLTMHHIVSDGWSVGVLIRELATLYEAFSLQETGFSDKRSDTRFQHKRSDDLPIQYADYAHWQREWLRGDVLEAQLDYWKRQLSGSPPLLALPTDRPRPAIQGYRGGNQRFRLCESLSKGLKDLSQHEGTTLFMTLLAAFQALLYRYTGQEDVSIGTPIANRNRSEIEGLIGFFVNTLVLRTNLAGEPDFREVLKRMREVALQAYAHQDLPFDMVVDALQPERDLSHTPLFQVMFVLQNAPSQALELPGLTLRPVDIEAGVAAFDLTLTMVEQPEGLSGVFEYNADLFDPGTIERIAGHFQTLLEGVVANPDQAISALPLLTEGERRQLLVEWNDTAVTLPQAQCVHELFEAQAARTPGAVAIALPAMDDTQQPKEGERQILTYQELNWRANQVAHYLRGLGVGPEVVVGISVERSLEMAVGLLGILKAGGAYLPLDPAYPAERLRFMVEDAQVPVLLTQARLVGRVPAGEAQIVCLDADWERIAQKGVDDVESGVRPEDLAYVIYTSGSTGQPKGVMVAHQAVVNHNLAVAEEFRLGPEDHVLQFATINFDAAVEEMFPAWLSGAQVVLRPEGALGGAEELERLSEEAGLTVLDLPTAYWHGWVSELASRGRRPPSSLRLVVVGGEKVRAEQYARWWEVAGCDVRWLNSYGPTEGTIIATLYEGQGEVEREVPIGRPISNVRLYVLDRRLQPVPVGVPGELHIGGAGVARGYLNRPELTAERFVPDPWGGRLYKTGDLVRYRPDGNAEFLGRVDYQVKVRGFRVEPGEIEAALNQHPALRESTVVAREDEGGNTRLVAYVVPTRTPRFNGEFPVPTIGELRDFLSHRLPEHMMPATFVFLDALPLTPGGKVDRRALPAPDQSRPALEAAYIAPRTGTEEILAAIWAQVLGLERVGVHDNFFELGGDSILSIQTIARANQAGLQLRPRQLFQHPTVAELAAVAGQGAVVQAEQGTVEGAVALTPIQRWFLEQWQGHELPAPHHWNQAVVLEARERLDPGLLREATKHLLAQHDALRLRLRRGEAGWEQVNVGLGGEVPFTWEDLGGIAAEPRQAAIKERAAALQASLNLEEGPLMRMAYFDPGEGQPGYLLVVVHHMAVDGVSWRILLEDLQTAYGQLKEGAQVALPPKTTSFQYWAQRLTEYARSDDVRQELGYWLPLTQEPAVPLPVDLPGGANTEALARSVTISLSAEETRALLQEVPAAYGTEINDALVAALAQALAQWTGSQRVLIDLEGHGREDLFEDVDLSRTVGWFTSMYPVRLNLAKVRGPGEALKAVKEQLRQVPRRGIGYGLLCYLSEDAGEVKQLRGLPPASVSFNYLGQFDQLAVEASPDARGVLTPPIRFALTRVPPGPSRSLAGRRSHLLDINGGIAGGQLEMEWTYSEGLHRQETVERVAGAFAEALRAIIAHCRTPAAVGYTPSDFPDVALSQEEIEALMAEVGQAI